MVDVVFCSMLLVDWSVVLDDAVVIHWREPYIVLFADRAFHLSVCSSLSDYKGAWLSVVSVHDRKHNFLEFFESFYRREFFELLMRFRLSHDIETWLSLSIRPHWSHYVVLRLACEFVSRIRVLLLYTWGLWVSEISRNRSRFILGFLRRWGHLWVLRFDRCWLSFDVSRRAKCLTAFWIRITRIWIRYLLPDCLIDLSLALRWPRNFLLLFLLDVTESSDEKWILEVNIRVGLHIRPLSLSRASSLWRLVDSFGFFFDHCKSFLLFELLQTLLLDFLELIPLD